MDELRPFTREQAIADGLLIDITEDIGRELGIPCPVAVSAALYGHPEIAGHREHIGSIVGSGLGDERWFDGTGTGEFEFSIIIDNPTHAAFVGVRVVLEPSEEYGVVATFLEASEEYDLRCPRSNSLYTM